MQGASRPRKSSRRRSGPRPRQKGSLPPSPHLVHRLHATGGGRQTSQESLQLASAPRAVGLGTAPRAEGSGSDACQTDRG
eukprot:10052754-Alexandrium_andersonii.AAC.1